MTAMTPPTLTPAQSTCTADNPLQVQGTRQHTSFACSGEFLKPIDVFESISKGSQELTLTSEQTGLEQSQELDARFWLPFASKQLNISAKLEDYVIVPTVGFWTGIPNVNGDAVTADELMRYEPKHGRCAYKTWKGKPTYWNHQSNTDPTVASGVIFDSYVSTLKGYAKPRLMLILLLGFDRYRNPELAKQILNRSITSYSVGMFYSSYINSVTGTRSRPNNPDPMTKPNQPTFMNEQGTLVFRYLENITGFECSAVNIPVFASAVGDTIMDGGSGKVTHY